MTDPTTAGPTPLPPSPRVAVVIVNYRTADLTMAALAAVDTARARTPGLSVVVVDGGSPDDSAARLRAAIDDPRWRDWVTFLPLAINGGFGWANNQAILHLTARAQPPDLIHILNPDARIEPEAIEKLVEVFITNSRAGAVGSLLIDDDGSASGSAFRFPSAGREFLRGIRVALVGRLLGIKPIVIASDTVTRVDWATGASVMMRRDALLDAGLFDTGFFLYFEEVELMWRMRSKGWQVLHQPTSRVWHIGGAATGMTYNQKELRVAPPLPAYWFAARQRMFVLTRGRMAATLANLAWLLGHLAFLLFRAVGGRRKERVTRDEAKMLVRHGLIPDAREGIPAIARIGDRPGDPPAWMANGPSVRRSEPESSDGDVFVA